MNSKSKYLERLDDSKTKHQIYNFEYSIQQFLVENVSFRTNTRTES